MNMRNDDSFIVSFVMNLWEHQSAFNTNMPMRFLLYAARLSKKYIAATEISSSEFLRFRNSPELSG